MVWDSNWIWNCLLVYLMALQRSCLDFLYRPGTPYLNSSDLGFNKEKISWFLQHLIVRHSSFRKQEHARMV